MKRQFIGWTLVMVLLSVAAGCSDDNSLKNIQKDDNGQAFTITCIMPQIGDNTRATLGSDGVTPVWEENDEIGLLVDDYAGGISGKLSSGAGTNTGTFYFERGIASGKTIYVYYPIDVMEDYFDLSSQTGTDVKKMAMYATCERSDNPVLKFKNKSTILKLEIPVPDGFNKESTAIKTTVLGAYNKGKLNLYGRWTNLSVGNIEVQNTKIEDDKLTAYVVVIPGTKVSDLRFEVSDGTNLYCTPSYANHTATIQENQLITITKPLTKVLVWTDATTAADVTAAITDQASRSRAATNPCGTLIVASDDDLTYGYNETDNKFEGNLDILKEGIDKYKENTGNNVNLTLLNQKEMPIHSFYEYEYLASITLPACTYLKEGSFQFCKNLVSISCLAATDDFFQYYQIISGCTSLKYVSMPNLTGFNRTHIFSDCTALKTIEFPNATNLSSQCFHGCTGLEYVFVPSVTTYKDDAFDGCNKKKITLVVGENATWYEPASDWKDVLIYKNGAFLSIYNNINGNTIDISYDDEDWDS